MEGGASRKRQLPGSVPHGGTCLFDHLEGRSPQPRLSSSTRAVGPSRGLAASRRLRAAACRAAHLVHSDLERGRRPSWPRYGEAARAPGVREGGINAVSDVHRSRGSRRRRGRRLFGWEQVDRL